MLTTLTALLDLLAVLFLALFAWLMWPPACLLVAAAACLLVSYRFSARRAAGPR